MKPDPFASLDPAWDSYRRAASWTRPYLDALEAYVDRFERLDAKPGKAKSSPYREGSISSFRAVPVRLMEMVRSYEDEFDRRDNERNSGLEEYRRRDLFFEEPSNRARDILYDDLGFEKNHYATRYLWLGSLSTLLRQGHSLLRLRGGPGTGKTWVTRLAVTDLIEHYRFSEGRIPVWVSASGLLTEIQILRTNNELLGPGFRWNAGNQSESIADCIARSALKELGAATKVRIGPKQKKSASQWVEGAAKRLAELLRDGKAVLTVDALDQCSNPVRVREIVEGFARTQKTSLLITGRPYAIPADDPAKSIRTLETLRWNLVQIQAYGESESLDSDSSKGLAEGWRRNSSQELVAVPQLLAFVVEGIKESPTFGLDDFLSLTKFQLFQRTLGVRAKGSGLTPKKLNCLSDFALEHWRDHIGHNELLYVRRSQLKDLWKPALRANLIGRVAEDYLGEERAEWSHRSILEFLAGVGAARRVSTHMNKAEALAGLASLGFDPESHELLRFAYGCLLEMGNTWAEELLNQLADSQFDDTSRARLATAVILSHDAPTESASRSETFFAGRWMQGQVSFWGAITSSPSLETYKAQPLAYEVPLGAIAKELTEELWAAIGDSDAVKHLANALGLLGDSSSLPSLTRALSSQFDGCEFDWNAIAPIAVALNQLGDPSPILIYNQALSIILEEESVDWNSIRMMAYAIDQIGDPSTAGMLNQALSSALSMPEINWLTVWFIAGPLGRIGDPSSVFILNSALSLACRNHGLDVNTVRSIANALGKLGDPTSANFLVEALTAVLDTEKLDWDVASEVTEALGILGDPSSTSVLNRALKAALQAEEVKWETVTQIAGDLARLGDLSSEHELHEPLKTALLSEVVDWFHVTNLAHSVGRLGDPIAEGVLTRTIAATLEAKEVDWMLVALCAEALGRLGNPVLTPNLRNALSAALDAKSVDWFAVSRVARALSRLGDHSSAPKMGDALTVALHAEEVNWFVVAELVDAIGYLGDVSSKPPLIEALSAAVQEDSKYRNAPFTGASDVCSCIGKALGRCAGFVSTSLTSLPQGRQIDILDQYASGVAERSLSHFEPDFVSDCLHLIEDYPGILFRLCHSLVHNLPRDQPRHWIGGEFRRTSELVRWDWAN